MIAICLTLPEQPERTERARKHILERWPELDLHFITGVNGYKTGLASTHPYEHDHPNSGYVIGPATIGIFLSHYIAWSITNYQKNSGVLIFEDDVVLPSNFKDRAFQAMKDAGEDCDVLFLGSCCTEGHPKFHVSGSVYGGLFPQCLHAYVLSKRAARTLMEGCRDVYGPVDCILARNKYFGLKVMTVLPRIAEQIETELPT